LREKDVDMWRRRFLEDSEIYTIILLYILLFDISDKERANK